MVSGTHSRGPSVCRNAAMPCVGSPARAPGPLPGHRSTWRLEGLQPPSLHGTGGHGPQASQTLIEERPCSEAARLRAQAFLESEWWSRQQYSGVPVPAHLQGVSGANIRAPQGQTLLCPGPWGGAWLFDLVSAL